MQISRSLRGEIITKLIQGRDEPLLGYEPNSFKFSLSSEFEIQSKAPSFHSWKVPSSKTPKKSNRASPIKKEPLLKIKLPRIGNKRATSTSKIKNKTTSKKKRVENGVRVFLRGSNPHSNADIFSLLSE